MQFVVLHVTEGANGFDDAFPFRGVLEDAQFEERCGRAFALLRSRRVLGKAIIDFDVAAGLQVGDGDAMGLERKALENFSSLSRSNWTLSFDSVMSVMEPAMRMGCPWGFQMAWPRPRNQRNSPAFVLSRNSTSCGARSFKWDSIVLRTRSESPGCKADSKEKRCQGTPRGNNRGVPHNGRNRTRCW